MMKHYLWCVALAHKLGRTALAALFGITIICSGCGNGDGIVTPTETEVAEVTEVTEAVEETVQVITSHDGDSIYFKIGNTFYEGTVVEGVSADEVLVKLADGGEKVINVDRIGGTLIADHPDLGIDVRLLGNQDKGESILGGKVTAGYSDDMRKIEILNVKFIDGRFELLDVKPIRFVSEHTDFEDGGYLTLDEFAEWLAD